MDELAILAPSQTVAVDWLHANCHGAALDPATGRGNMQLHGVERPFVIATEERHLRGRLLIGFEIVGRGVPTMLVELAATRVRR